MGPGARVEIYTISAPFQASGRCCYPFDVRVARFHFLAGLTAGGRTPSACTGLEKKSLTSAGEGLIRVIS